MSLSTYRDKYKGAAEWQVNRRRAMVGQSELKAKKKNLPSAVLVVYMSQLKLDDIGQKVTDMQTQKDLGDYSN